MRPHSLFETSKRECAAPGGREKMFRRVGPRQRGPPAAGGRRLAFPRGSQGRKRAALGVIQAWGSRGYSPLLFYPQGVRRIRKAAEPQTAAQPLPLTFSRGARADTQVGPYKTMAVSCSPVGADLRVRPLERPFTGPWSGSGFRSRDHSMTTPVFSRTGHAGQGRSKHVARREPAEGRRVWSAPARKTPVRAEGNRTGAQQSGFLFGPRTARFSFARQKRNGGCGPLSGPDKFPAETGGMRQAAAAAAITGRGTPCRCTSSTSGRCRRGTGRCGRSW